MHPFTILSDSPEETRRIGAALGRLAAPGLVIALRGTLGAGKTTFVQGVAEGAGTPDPKSVTSPTFVLIQEYTGRIPVYHFDAYRLRGVEEFADLGADEYLFGDGVCVVEWAERVTAALPNDRIEIEFVPAGESHRRLEVSSLGDRWPSLAERWRTDAVRRP